MSDDLDEFEQKELTARTIKWFMRSALKQPKRIETAQREARIDERIKCAQIAAKECPCGMEFSKCHVAQEILLAREEQEAKGE